MNPSGAWGESRPSLCASRVKPGIPSGGRVPYSLAIIPAPSQQPPVWSPLTSPPSRPLLNWPGGRVVPSMADPPLPLHPVPGQTHPSLQGWCLDIASVQPFFTRPCPRGGGWLGLVGGKGGWVIIGCLAILTLITQNILRTNSPENLFQRH